jgi:hypothetical protein
MSEHKKRGRPAKAIKVDPKGATETYFKGHALVSEALAERSTEVTDMATPDPEATEKAVKAVLKSIYRSGQHDQRRNLTEDYDTITKLMKGSV